MNMGIKQNYMPSMPSEPHQVGISPLKETIHGSILWSKAFVDENMTIDPIMNVMTLTELCFTFFNKDAVKVPQVLKHLIKLLETF
jgi:hypothetical protein